MLPEHQIPLGDTEWALWRRNGVRSAGFAAEEVAPLASATLAAAADRVLDAETALETARAEARAAVDAALDALRQEGGWEDAGRRKPLLDARRAAARGGGAALETLEQRRAELAAAFETALAGQAEAIHAAAREPRFREAVLWQNRAAFHTGVEAVAAHPPATTKRDTQRRQHEEMVASYLQRYTVKNDTIGFFGPLSQLDFTDQGPALAARPGPGLIAESRVLFESWCLEELARPFARHELIRPWLHPRRAPIARVEGQTLHLSGRRSSVLPPRPAAVLAACDGERTARAIAIALLADPALGFAAEKEVYAVLDQLLRQGLVSWNFCLPWGPGTAESLAAQLAGIGHPKLCAVAQQTFDTFDRGRQQVAAALGDPVALDRALERLEATFQRLTGTAPTRRAGETYGARTLVYLDCRRDLEVSCGPELMRELAAPLGLVLDGVRWFTHEIAKAARGIFFDVFRQLLRPGETTVDPTPFIGALQPRLSDVGYLGEIKRRLLERWHELLGARLDQRRLELRTADLRERADQLFACPGPGWPTARCHSPDVMIAAASPEAVCAGDYQLVLGELHLGVNSLNSWAFLAVWPEREKLLRQLDHDIPEPRLALLLPKHGDHLTTRTLPAYSPPQELMIPLDAEPWFRIPGQELSPAELVIEEEAGQLIIRSRDGRHRLDATTAWGGLLSKTASAEFAILPESSHWPRITLDRMILHRETWKVPAAEMMVFAGVKSPAERYLAARRWARSLGLPRRVFVKSPIERKPIYADFASPIYVDLLAKLARRTAQAPENLSIKLSEMVPGPGELWLPDAQGRRYCSELRLVAIDRRGLPPQ